MVSFGKRQFELNARQKDGATLRDHLKVAWNASGIKPEQLDYEELQENVQYLWSWFIDLDYYRGSSMNGVNPITPTLIKDWCWMNDVELEYFERMAIKRLDVEYMKQQAKEK